MKQWTCPKCQRRNSGQFARCPVCKTRDPARPRTDIDRKRHQARMRGFMEGNGR